MNSTQGINTCKNCGNTFEGKFCSNCGQRSDIRRFTIKSTISEVLHTFTHVDKGLLYLIKELFLRPGIVAKEYIEGKRKNYFSPIQYLLIVVAVATFLSVNFNLMGPAKVDANVYKDLTENMKMTLQFNEFIYKYFNVILLIAVPLMALFTRWFYASSGYNYSENVIFHSFIAAQRTLIFILISPLLYIFRSYWYIFIGLYYLGWIIYFGWAFTQFFNGKKKFIIIKYVFLIIFFIAFIQSISWGLFYLFIYKR